MHTLSKTITAICLLCCAAKAAAAPVAPDAGQMLRESTPPPVLAPPRQPDISTPADKPAVTPESGVRIAVAGFTYQGNTLFSAAELDAIMAPYVGKELTLADLERAVGNITNAYRAKGYLLASASLPPQSIKPGRPVLVAIVEGALEKINLKTTPVETRTSRTVLERYTNRLTPGAPVNADDLTETVLLMNELPAIKTRVTLEPGAEPGSTAATLEVAEGRGYRASLFGDNHGNYATGYYRIGAGLDLYSPFRLGDRLSVRGHTATSGDSQGAGITYAIPVSSSGTTLTLDYSYVGYHLGRSFAALDADGHAHGFTLSLVQPLVRKTDLYLNAVLSGAGRLLEDTMNAFSYTTRRHTAGGSAGLNLYAADNLLGGGSTTFGITWAGGVLGLDDATGGDPLKLDGSYYKLSGFASRSQTLHGPLSLFASFSGQWSDENLDSSEEFSLGGPYGVRAYPVGEASSDLGMLTTVELRYLLPACPTVPGRVTVLGLFDHGYGQIDANPLPGSTGNVRHLYGAGFGVNWQWNDHAGLKSSVAWRLGEHPTSDSGDKPTVYFHLALAY